MKLRSVRIKNFRAFRDVTIPFNDYVCLVGPNGAGKSTVIAALDVFFRHPTSFTADVANLQEQDFHHSNTDDPIEVTLTFEGLSVEAQADLKHYCRLGKLIVVAQAKWNAEKGAAPVEQYGIRLAMKPFAPFFEAFKDGKSANDLKEIYKQLAGQFSGLPSPGTKQAMYDALRDHESQHPELCDEILSGDQFYGATKGQNLISKYIQWVHVPAVKDASDEQAEAKNTWLGQLLQRAVRSKVHFDAELGEIRDVAQS